MEKEDSKNDFRNDFLFTNLSFANWRLISEVSTAFILFAEFRVERVENHKEIAPKYSRDDSREDLWRVET